MAVPYKGCRGSTLARVVMEVPSQGLKRRCPCKGCHVGVLSRVVVWDTLARVAMCGALSWPVVLDTLARVVMYVPLHGLWFGVPVQG